MKRSLAILSMSITVLAQTALAAPINKDKILSQAPNLNPRVLDLGIKAYHKALRQGYDRSGIITLVDFTKPSDEKRFYVINLKQNRVLFDTYTTQGKGSGRRYAHHFSNTPNSLASSIGVYKTESPYVGQHGFSLRLDGLEEGFNSNARSRDIVVHAANYASSSYISSKGRAGLSWGCFVLGPRVNAKVIKTIKDQTIILAYYPDRKWLKTSRFINS